MYDVNDPRWRYTKPGRAAYATFARGIKRSEAPPETGEEFNRGNKGDLFKGWARNGGDWLETCYAVGLRTRTVDLTSNQHKLWSKAEIQTKWGSSGRLCAKCGVCGECRCTQ